MTADPDPCCYDGCTDDPAWYASYTDPDVPTQVGVNLVCANHAPQIVVTYMTAVRAHRIHLVRRL
jgi:hypothetical protein